MKSKLFILLSVLYISCSAQYNVQQSDSLFVFSYEMDGKTITDTVKIKDGYKIAIQELNKMMKDLSYRPTIKNDTIKDQNNKPVIVVLDDDIFGAQIVRFKYNEANQLISCTGHNRNGQISPFDKDIAIQTYKYDENGNMIELRNHGDDGNFISSEFEDTPIIKLVYNENGKQTEEWYLNEYGELRAPYAIAKYEYSQSGERVLIGWFNEQGEKEKK